MPARLSFPMFLTSTSLEKRYVTLYSFQFALVYNSANPFGRGTQVGNVSWLLEEGEESDVYDFLELYIRRWQGVAARIEEDCSSRRMLRATGQVPLETAPTPAAAPRRLSQILPTDWNGEGEAPEPMQHLTRPYFNRTFHPYDW